MNAHCVRPSLYQILDISLKKKTKKSLLDIKTYNTLIINLINNETPFT